MGDHDADNIKRERHFLLEIDVAAGLPMWSVAGPGTGMQSKAQAIALDSQGRYITGGQTCANNCDNPTGELRMFLPGGAQIWQRALDPGIAAPRDLAWSPADYVVLVSARDQGPNDTAFFAQGWIPLKDVPIWSYDRHHPLEFQSADALAIGPYGQIYAGGQGASGLPAIAIIAP